MAKFRTVYERNRVYSDSGSKMANEYKLIVNDDGESVFKKVGEFNLYDQIQSYKDSCDLEKIIEKFKITGDPSVLTQKQTFYADVTTYPQTYAEMLELSQKAKEMFYSLDNSDRAKFNNDPDQFFSSIGSEKFNSIFNYNESVGEPNVESEDVNNE